MAGRFASGMMFRRSTGLVAPGGFAAVMMLRRLITFMMLRRLTTFMRLARLAAFMMFTRFTTVLVAAWF